MTDEQYWNERAAKLRRFMGLCPLTPVEAEEALSKAKRRKASVEEVDLIVDAVTLGELPDVEDQPSVDWSAEYDHSAMDREAALCRNEGDAGNESSETEDELLEELFREDGENGVDEVEN